MSKFNKLIVTTLCSLMLVCSLTVFHSDKNIVKADTGLLTATIDATILGLIIGSLGYSIQCDSANGISYNNWLYDNWNNFKSTLSDATLIPTTVAYTMVASVGAKFKINQQLKTAVSDFVTYLTAHNLNTYTTTGFYIQNGDQYIPINYNVPAMFTMDYYQTCKPFYTAIGLSSQATSYTTVFTTTFNGHTYKLDVIVPSWSAVQNVFRITFDDNLGVYTALTYGGDGTRYGQPTITGLRTFKFFLGSPNNNPSSNDALQFYAISNDGYLYQLYTRSWNITAGSSFVNLSSTYGLSGSADITVPDEYEIDIDDPNATNLDDILNAIKNNTFSNTLSNIASVVESIGAGMNVMNRILETIKTSVANIFSSITSVFIPSNSLVNDIDDIKTHINTWISNLTTSLASIQTYISSYALSNSFVASLTAINSAVFGGFVTMMNNNNIGIFMFLGLIVILLGIVL